MKSKVLIFTLCFFGGAVLLLASNLRKQTRLQDGHAPWRLALEKDDKWGVIDSQGNWICEPILADMPYYWDGCFTIRKGDESEYYDPRRQPLIQEVVHLGGLYSEGMVSFVDQKNGKVGYKAGTGRTAIEPRFEVGMPFHQGYAGVVIDGKLNFIDTEGEVVVKTQLENIDHAFRWGDYILIQQLGKVGFLDLKGKVIVEPQYEEAMPFSRGLSRIKVKRRYGFINPKGELVVEAKYNPAYPFEGERALVWGKEVQAFLIDTQGREVKSFAGKDFIPMHMGKEWIMFAGQGFKFGFMDYDENIKIEPIYGQAMPFVDGTALVQKGKELMMIDRSGKVLANLGRCHPDEEAGLFGYGAVYFTQYMENWLSYGSSKTNTPAYVAKTFLKAMEDRDFETALRYGSKKAQTTLKMMHEMDKGKEQAKKKVVMGKLTVEDKTARVAYTEDGTEKYLDLVREQGLWKAAFSK